MGQVSRWIVAGCVALSLLAGAGSAQAQVQDYPSKPIHIYVGFPAGGPGIDLPARFVAERLSALARQPVVVENKVGAAGNIAAEAAARSRPDGYTLLFSPSGPSASNLYLFKKLPFDPQRDFTPITTMFWSTWLLLVNPARTPVNSVAELTEFLKKKGGSALFGVPNTPALIASEFYRTTIGIEGTPVSYKSSVESGRELAAGELDFLFLEAASSVELARTGRARALAVTSLRRTSLAPDLPTMIEAGIPGFDVSAWLAAFAPAGTPAPIVEKLSGWLNQVLAMEETKRFLAGVASDPFPGNPAALADFQKSEIEKWGRLFKLAKIEPQ